MQPVCSSEESGLESHEIVRDALDRVGTKVVAQKMNLSYSTVSKWGEVPPQGEERGSGSRNPLDRAGLLYEVTKHLPIIKWFCREAGGFFVANPPAEKSPEIAREFVAQTRDVVREFYRLIEVMSESYENDGRIDERESESIRSAWEKLKSIAESFVHACEQGYYS